MKKVFYLFSLLIMSGMIFASCTNASKQSAATDGVDSTEVVAADEGWITLFNGTDFTGWRGYNRADMPAAWTIEDGAIKINGSGMGEAGAKDGGDIIYDQKFKNFELTFEWKVSEGGNSGIFYLAQEVEGNPSTNPHPNIKYSTTKDTQMQNWVRTETVSRLLFMIWFLPCRRIQNLLVNGIPVVSWYTRAPLSTLRMEKT